MWIQSWRLTQQRDFILNVMRFKRVLYIQTHMTCSRFQIQQSALTEVTEMVRSSGPAGCPDRIRIMLPNRIRYAVRCGSSGDPLTGRTCGPGPRGLEAVWGRYRSSKTLCSWPGRVDFGYLCCIVLCVLGLLVCSCCKIGNKDGNFASQEGFTLNVYFPGLSKSAAHF